jgi:hypothetical protein
MAESALERTLFRQLNASIWQLSQSLDLLCCLVRNPPEPVIACRILGTISSGIHMGDKIQSRTEISKHSTSVPNKMYKQVTYKRISPDTGVSLALVSISRAANTER